MKKHLYDIVREPWITEKVTIRILKESKNQKKYAFRVHPEANKKEIKSAVEKIFNVHVTDVNTMNCRGKWRRVRYQPGQTPDWKKAVVTLRKGEEIDITSQK